MIRARYADLKPELARIAGATGMNVTDTRVLSYTNLATQELIDEWDWPQLVVRMQFKTTNCRINVPSEFDRILALCVNNVPMVMQSPWYEFVGYGPQFPGTPPTAFDNNLLGELQGVLDMQERATFQDIPADGSLYYPTVYATMDERVQGIRPTIILQGYDNNGQWIRSLNAAGTQIDGVELAINGDASPYGVTSPVPFSEITGAIKPITKGYLSVYMTGGTQPNFFVVTYAPYETQPFYRRYEIPGLASGTTYCMKARLRKRFVPIVNDNDMLMIPNLPALSTMVQAVYYRESGNLQNYASFKLIAVDILKKEMTSYIGKQRQKPLITMPEGSGVRPGGIYIR